jgi:CRISPR-associated protein Cas1
MSVELCEAARNSSSPDAGEQSAESPSEREIGASISDAQPELLPARMLNEYAYCPRLGYLEWVQGEFAENLFTEEGTYAHRRVDEREGELAPADDEQAPKISRSIMLTAPKLRLVAKIDLVETEGCSATPVDYKRGKKPDIPEGAWEPERVQLCAQGLILRGNGFQCDQGVIYYVASKERVHIVFDQPLIDRTLALAKSFRELALKGVIPAPLEDSPKCNDCSLNGICLPDETSMLMEPAKAVRTEPRRLSPARDDALPVYVQTQGCYLSKNGDALVVKEKGQKIAESRLFETSQISLFGNVQISTQLVRELCRRGIPVVYFSTGGWFYGLTLDPMHKNVELRIDQFRAVDNPERSLVLARRFVATKIRNCRTLLRRNADAIDKETLRRLRQSAIDAECAENVESLLGIEGDAARVYFGAFSLMIKRSEVGHNFSFDGRNRRPPKDPVNALLSLAYSLLVKDLTVTLAAVGFDPFLGFYHRPRYGRPSLALDLMEEFRPLVADSTVIGAINNGVVALGDFIRVGGGMALKPHARKAFISAYERRMDQLIRHPVFGYQISYRRVLEVQCRLLGRYLSGEIADYPEFLTR